MKGARPVRFGIAGAGVLATVIVLAVGIRLFRAGFASPSSGVVEG